jgi:hypothetical protein
MRQDKDVINMIETTEKSVNLINKTQENVTKETVRVITDAAAHLNEVIEKAEEIHNTLADNINKAEELVKLEALRNSVYFMIEHEFHKGQEVLATDIKELSQKISEKVQETYPESESRDAYLSLTKQAGYSMRELAAAVDSLFSEKEATTDVALRMLLIKIRVYARLVKDEALEETTDNTINKIVEQEI